MIRVWDMNCMIRVALFSIVHLFCRYFILGNGCFSWDTTRPGRQSRAILNGPGGLIVFLD